MEKEKTSIYILIKDWFDWCKHNREKNNPTLTALYFWIVEKCNSLGWVNSFGLPTDEAMHILGIGSYNTYKKNLLLLQDIGFINIVEFSKNQYTSNIIALSKFNKADAKHLTKQMQSKSKAPDKVASKQIEYNNTINTKKTINTIKTNKNKYKERFSFLFSHSEFEESFNDFVEMRKAMKAVMTERAKELLLIKLCDLSKKDVHLSIEILNQSILNNWKGIFSLKNDSEKSNNYGKSNNSTGNKNDELIEALAKW